MLTCRISALLHIPPSDVDELAIVDRYLLGRYWAEEPWGAWRDNMHAAIIAREIRRGYMKDRTAPLPLEPFLLRPIDQRQAQNRTGFVQLLRMMAGGKPVAPAPPTEASSNG